MALNSLVSRFSGSIWSVVGHRRTIGGAISAVHNAAAGVDLTSKSVVKRPSNVEGYQKLKDRFPHQISGCPFKILHDFTPSDELYLYRSDHGDYNDVIKLEVKVHNDNDTNTSVERISMLVKISSSCKNVVQFKVHAFAHHPERIIITEITISDGNRKPSGHVEGFETYFEERGISLKGLSFLFDYISKGWSGLFV